jgi:uncharacterized membrane protein (DUF4010 family)
MNLPIFTLIPADVIKIFLVLFLSFLIGLEREEQKSAPGKYVFGGVRTYPLIGLIGYGMAFLSTTQLLPLAAGFLVVGGLMMVSYWHKTQSSKDAGLTSEMAGLLTYLVGALVYSGQFWVASTLVITSLILLELKSILEGLAHRFSPDDILTFTKFLFLTLVVLPILPNQAFGSFQINPFKTWLVVVAVSTISYGSFLLQKVVKGRGGVMLTALLGGAYSSTVTTVALAKRSTTDQRPHAYAGAILLASGVMYLRLGLLVSLFSPALLRELILPFIVLALAGVGGGWLWATKADRSHSPAPDNQVHPAENPLELKAAFLFAFLFVFIVILTHYTVVYLGNRGVYVLAGIMGVTDVDPFILGITQSAGQSIPLSAAGAAILIAAASNNLIKGIYAISFGDRQTGRQSFGLLLILAIAGLVPSIWLIGQ